MSNFYPNNSKNKFDYVGNIHNQIVESYIALYPDSN